MVLCATARVAAGEPPAVLIVASERGGGYAETIEALTIELERGGLSRSSIAVIGSAEWATQTVVPTRLQIAIGSSAAQLLHDSDSKLAQLYTLLPRSSAERLLAARRPGRTVAALCLDQPLARQLDLLRLALPEQKNLAVLWGPASRGQQAELLNVATERGLRLLGAHVERGDALYPTLRQLLGEADVLLAIADPLIYNSSSIQNILLASFRARVPLIAFSPAYVKAGALMAIYSTPAQIGSQAGAMARSLLQGRTLAALQFPLQFNLQVNQHVAHSLGLHLDESALFVKLREQEHNP